MGLFEDVLKSRTGSGQGLSVVPFREWNERVVLAASAVEGPKRNGRKRFPSTKIQHVIDRMMYWNEALQNIEDGTNAEAYMGTAKFDVDQAVQLSRSLRETQSLGRVHVEKWVSDWEHKGLFGGGTLNSSFSGSFPPYNGRVPRARL